ncbi:uncharacterized protein LOC111599620 [Drosophila hydei]|uniref:Uncharacterized protein LOC111599620 n=1 Tax=Drosophila hydei TaxID=7224 RepID=A0A6J1LT68_DROHY|nr:uncharacterized protein LOC111599620 [Drosophila hydei]
MLAFNLVLLLALLGSCECKRLWTHELLEIHTYSEDESKIKLEARIERQGRYLVGISGSGDLQYDFDNTTLFEVIIHHSSSGSESDYKPLPMAVPKKRLVDLKKMYDDIVYPAMKDCSNMPQIEGDLLWPWPRDLYTFDMCNFDKGNLPEIMSEGYYKIFCTFSGEVNWSLSYLVYVKTKLI